MEQSRFMTIAHGLAVVEFMSDRVGVMYLGRLAEIANADQLYGRPLHPYTKALMRAAMATDLPRGRHEAIDSGRGSIPHQPTDGLSLSHALPLRQATLRRDRAATDRDRARPRGRLSFRCRGGGRLGLATFALVTAEDYVGS